MYFYWIVRLRSEALWFKHVLESISLDDPNHLIDINIHVTSIRNANDVRLMLYRLVQYHEKNISGICPVSEMQTRALTKFGRPNWNEVFPKIKDIHLGSVEKCGVFFCGPHSLAKVLKKQCNLHSETGFKFVFRKEIF